MSDFIIPRKKLRINDDEPTIIIPNKKPRIDAKKKLLILVLFGGTCSFRRAVRLLGLEDDYEVVEVDINPKHNPEIVADILTWEYKAFINEHKPYMIHAR